MNLIQALNRKLLIEGKIIDHDGEISEIDEENLSQAINEIEHQLDRAIFIRTKLKEDLESYKAALKSLIDIYQKKIENFDCFLKMVVDVKGPIKTPLCSLNTAKRKTRKVVIQDFDACMRAFPEAVKVETIDNVRKTTISKTLLKDKTNSQLKKAGCYIEESESEYINARHRYKGRITEDQVRA